VVERAQALAAEIATGSLAALRAIKTTMRDGQRDAILAARSREDAAFAALLGLPMPAADVTS
jgi:enoyl-CoA hydratase/carnithine racemase